MNQENNALGRAFIDFSLRCQVLRFGEFKTKAGRMSPYFFNAGLFNDGQKLGELAGFYARKIVESGVQFDMLFGPAYKGIPLVAAVAIELARLGHNYPFAFNRKEVKDHGEGGSLVGAPLEGRILILDDVISAGTAVRESIGIIRAAHAIPYAMMIALDRQEKAKEAGVDLPHSAVHYVRDEMSLDVIAIAKLDDLLGFLKEDGHADFGDYYSKVEQYRVQYGVQD